MPPVEAATMPETLADLLTQLGEVPPGRIPLRPPLGSAVEMDVIEALERADKRLYELVDGVLVEKPMGALESRLAIWLSHLLVRFLETNNLGDVFGADGPFRLMPGLVRFPDVAFVTWERLSTGSPDDSPIADVVPDLAIEVLSESNTKKEMQRKLQDYFENGVRLVWLVDPRKQHIDVYTAPEVSRRLISGDTLDGGDVLPGFAVGVALILAGRQPRL